MEREGDRDGGGKEGDMDGGLVGMGDWDGM